MLPEMSQIATRLGQRCRCPCLSMDRNSPPCLAAARMVARQSASLPRRSASFRRDLTGATGSEKLASNRLASAISEFDICSKSSDCNLSLPATVPDASHAKSRSSSGPSWPEIFVPGSRAEQCLGGAPGRCLGLPFGRHAAHRRQQQRHHVFVESRIAPEQPEQLAKDLHVPCLRDQAGMKHPVEIPAIQRAGCQQRPHCLAGLPRADRQSGLPQGPAKMHEIVQHLPVRPGLGE